MPALRPSASAAELFSRGDLIRIQRHADNRVSLAQLPLAQAAMVALAPENGGIRAIVGGFDYRQSRFNRITQATRQPGSNFKPFIYTTALKNGFTPASIINDAPVVFDDNKLEETWRPENDGGKFYGPTRLREALYRSRNLVSIRLLRRMGIDRTLESLQAFGFDTSEMPLDLSLCPWQSCIDPSGNRPRLRGICQWRLSDQTPYSGQGYRPRWQCYLPVQSRDCMRPLRH